MLSRADAIALCAWFRENARPLPWRRDADPYHVWLSEIMLQQTRIEAVIPYYERFLSELPTIRDLAAVDEERLLKLWEGLGYYSRARNLHRAAKVVCGEHGGVFPDDVAGIRALPGIGDYTAGAIASICFGRKAPAVDGNVLRVCARYAERFEPVTEPSVKRRVTEALEAVYGYRGVKPSDLTQGLMELGEVVCLPSGALRCSVCPLAGGCRAYAHGTAADLPVRAPKKEKREVDVTVLILRTGDGDVAIRKRPDTGLLAGLWEFPNVEQRLSQAEALAFAEGLGVKPLCAKKGLSHTHVFTHIRWRMRSYVVDVEEAGGAGTTATAKQGGLRFVSPEELTETHALPTAFRKFIDCIASV
ncbi:MAG: A/G-specific adenine glycosylase [Clostridiales Family XIII bacterium]|jgi:A/G-specific adenine glycosylase|nr:A/G-specific adenine glycosylase [Clostridiales Family XIII bacterium]